MGGAIRLEGSPDEDQLKSTKAQFYCERADSFQLFYSVLGTKKDTLPFNNPSQNCSDTHSSQTTMLSNLTEIGNSWHFPTLAMALGTAPRALPQSSSSHSSLQHQSCCH